MKCELTETNLTQNEKEAEIHTEITQKKILSLEHVTFVLVTGSTEESPHETYIPKYVLFLKKNSV